jgi:hypothetical protein
VALSADRKTKKRSGEVVNIGLNAAAVIYQGAMVSADSDGYLVPARETATDSVQGMALQNVDNTAGADGDLLCDVERGVFAWDNSGGGDEITIADRGSVCYAVDDHTVALTSDGNARPPAGIVVDVDSYGVWVDHRQSFPGGADGDLVAANNLSDVGSATTSRGNLGIIHNMVLDPAVDLIGANTAQVRYVHSGPDMTINHLRTVASGALTTGAATLTADIEGTPVTNGVVTIADGGAEDDVDVASPSAANVISEGEVLTVTVGGTNDAAVFASLMLEGSY